jgi:histidine triad (HIT) family protein
MGTIFSKIIAGDIPGTFVYRDEHCVVFMTINPITDGHVLVVPILEVDHWIDLPPEVSAHVFSVSQRISRALSASFPCERIGLIIAGYEINHCHIHLIPTNSMADLNFANAAASVDRSSLEDHAQRIIAAL